MELEPGTYCFVCYPMPWTEIALGNDSNIIGNNEISVCVELSFAEIHSIIEMMYWLWDNHWMEYSTSETVLTDLLKTRLPQIFNKVQPLAHEKFCSMHPNSEHLEGFGVYEIFCPDIIIEEAKKTYNGEA